jgi:hypothetical protein
MYHWLPLMYHWLPLMYHWVYTGMHNWNSTEIPLGWDESTPRMYMA